MSEKISCEIIKDLLPTYIDGLSSDVTNKEIEKHLSHCKSCTTALEYMKNPDTEPINIGEKEIDIFKKVRKRTKRVLYGSIIIVISVIMLTTVGVFLSANYLAGDYIGSENVVFDVKVKGNTLELSASSIDESLVIKSADFSDNGGIITVSFNAVRKSFLYKGTYDGNYTSNVDIGEVWLSSNKTTWYGDRIVWAKGVGCISAMTAAVYNTFHPYVGDMSANSYTADALNISNYLGSFKNELQTAKEPYGWKIIFKDNFASSNNADNEKLMRSYAYVLIATIGNLSEVSFEYVVDEEKHLLTVTEQEANDFAGGNIKDFGKDISKLQSLLEKTELINLYYSDGFSYRRMGDLQVDIANLTDESFKSASISCYIDGKLYTSIGCENADSSLIKKGQIFSFILLPEDFGLTKWSDREIVSLEFTLYDKSNNECTAEKLLRIPAENNCRYSLLLTGNNKAGYTVTQ